MLTTKELLAAIRRFRKLKSISQKEMSGKLFISLRAYQRIEYGENKHIDVDIVQKIAGALDIPVSLLLNDNTDGSAKKNWRGTAEDKTISADTDDMIRVYREIIISLKEVIAFKDEIITHLMSVYDRGTKKATG